VLGAEFAPDLRGTEVANAVARIERRLGEVLGDVTDAALVVIEPTPRAERSMTAGGVAAGGGRS
jgi:hypothetical protein